MSKDEPLPLLFIAGGSRRGTASDNWRLERVRQVLGLVAKHWCEWRQADAGMASGPDSWMYIETDHLHDELFHETLRPIDHATFAYNFVGIPQGSDGQPLAITGQLPFSLIAWNSNGRGAWVRDIEFMSLPQLLYYFDMSTQLPGQAQGSSASDPKAIAQPMASQGNSQFMASQGNIGLWRVRGKLSWAY